ncbi:MAG: hypothetical protein NXH72_06155 [Hyphomonadaceae bacterium]|nr:hypothetical protein [Hyphomonadaceae bacterium]
MIYRGALSDLRPLVIVNSLDLPMPPPESFCELMWSAGYQVVFVRRPGFGSTPALPDALLSDDCVHNGAAVVGEAALIGALLNTLELENLVLMGIGSGNPICYRLSRLHPQIDFCIFANPTFNQDIWDVFRPQWLQAMLRQTLISKSGLKIATQGLQAILRSRPLWFFRQIVQKSPGDVNYVNENADDFKIAARLLQNVEPQTVFYDIRMSLVEDPMLTDEFFSGVNAVILSGQETTERWQSQLDKEAERLSLPVIYAPAGDMFVPYASPQTVLDILPLAQPASIRSVAF